MACGARSGLKHTCAIHKFYENCRLNGLWSPFGFETFIPQSLHFAWLSAKWPVEPVRV